MYQSHGSYGLYKVDSPKITKGWIRREKVIRKKNQPEVLLPQNQVNSSQ